MPGSAGLVVIAFDQEGDAYIGSGAGGRSWRITEERTGWRLEFRDVGDLTATNAGVHPSLRAAIAEAGREAGSAGRRR